jgi:hypothetical protein
VPGSVGIIDISILSHSNPRVASLDAFDRFLVVMQRYEAGVWQIWGRLRLAASTPHPIVFPISDPGLSGHCVNPDIGGDSGPGDKWLVVWERQLSATDFDIHARTVRADISLAPSTTFIENSAATIHSLPQVSQGNGNGLTSQPRWMVAYQFRFSATDEDIHGAVLDANGAITTPNQSIDRSVATDFVPSVSSPAVDLTTGSPLFMVTYERQSPLEARARVLQEVAAVGLVNQITPVSLTAAFGLGPFWVRTESDGCRFAVLSGSSSIDVATLALRNGALFLHEAPQTLPGIPSYPRIASKRSGGGPRTDYGIAYVDLNWFPDRILVTAYEGRTPGNDLVRRVMGCNGLGIDAAGGAALGETATFTLSNVGGDLPGFVFSAPVPASTAVCTSCPLGVAQSGAVALLGNPFTVAIPCNPSFVGGSSAVQGFALGSGPCIASLRFSDTIDLMVR